MNVQECYFTFDFRHITIPETGAEYESLSASFEQFRREFEDAVTFLPEILGYRFVEMTGGFAIVRFLSAEHLSDEKVQVLYDEGGLSGRFYAGRFRRFRVGFSVPTCEFVYAVSPEAARERFKKEQADTSGIVVLDITEV